MNNCEKFIEYYSNGNKWFERTYCMGMKMN